MGELTGMSALMEELREAKEYGESVRQRSVDYAKQLEEARALQNQIRNDLVGMVRSRDKWRAKYEAFTQCEAMLAKLLRAAKAEALLCPDCGIELATSCASARCIDAAFRAVGPAPASVEPSP